MGLSKEEQAIIVDHERAQTYGTKYLGRIQGELFNRGMKLTAAMDKFNEFLKLPPGDNRGAAVWGAAFDLLSTFVPALKIGAFLQKQNERATVAIALASQAGLKARKARGIKTTTEIATEVGKATKTVQDAKEKGTKAVENVRTITKDADPADSPLDKLDASRKPINELIQQGNKARENWELALDSELQEFENRLGGLPPTKPGSLDAYIRSLLEPLEKTYTVTELDEIELLYLWYMITAHVKKEVKINTLVFTSRKAPPQTGRQTIKGLNDTQKQTILTLFGDKARRGKIFFQPPVKSVYQFLKGAGVEENIETMQGDWDGWRGTKF